MITGSEEHKKHQRDEVDATMNTAIKHLSDEGVFSADQITVLQTALWTIRHAIHKTI